MQTDVRGLHVSLSSGQKKQPPSQTCPNATSKHHWCCFEPHYWNGLKWFEFNHSPEGQLQGCNLNDSCHKSFDSAAKMSVWDSRAACSSDDCPRHRRNTKASASDMLVHSEVQSTTCDLHHKIGKLQQPDEFSGDSFRNTLEASLLVLLFGLKGNWFEINSCLFLWWLSLLKPYENTMESAGKLWVS